MAADRQLRRRAPGSAGLGVALLVGATAGCGDDRSGGPVGPERPGTDASGAGDVVRVDLGGGGETGAAGDDSGAPGDACRVGALRCVGTTDREVCGAGGAWEGTSGCASGELCSRGTCGPPCAIDGKFDGSALGCEFWSVDLGQWHVGEGQSSLDPSVSVVPHAIMIGNPGVAPVTVSFEAMDGTPIDVPDNVVPALGARAFLMPVLSQQESAVTRGSVRVRTSAPVAASQFNPASNAPGFGRHSTDASLLLPGGLLGTLYFVVSNYGVEGFLGGPPSLGFLTVVATSEGTTRVRVVPKAPTMPGDAIPALAAGEALQVDLEQGQVLTLNAVPRPITATGPGGDLTGSQVITNRPVAVFGGHQCMVVGGGNCDHLETQLLPVERLGSRYVAVPFETPNPASVFRVVGTVPGTTLHTEPRIAGLDGVTLEPGGWVEASTSEAFELTSTSPVVVVQFIAGNDDESSAYLVDTSMTALVPVEQFRGDHALFVPEAFAVDRLQIVRTRGTDVTINGAAVSESFAAVGGGDFEVADVRVDDGAQIIASPSPVGLVLYGFDHKVSYALPGGVGAPR